jgi:hypothetical protein
MAGAAIGPAISQEWAFFDAPVKIEKVWHDELGEGDVSSGVTISDAMDKYDIICIVETEMGDRLPGVYVRWSDTFYQEVPGAPAEILEDDRGNSWTSLQWAEACQRLGIVR